MDHRRAVGPGPSSPAGGARLFRRPGAAARVPPAAGGPEFSLIVAARAKPPAGGPASLASLSLNRTEFAAGAAAAALSCRSRVIGKHTFNYS